MRRRQPGCAPSEECPNTLLTLWLVQSSSWETFPPNLFAFCSQLTYGSLESHKATRSNHFHEEGLDGHRVLPIKKSRNYDNADIPLSMQTPAVTRDSHMRTTCIVSTGIKTGASEGTWSRHISVSRIKKSGLPELLSFCERFASFSRSSEPPPLIESYFASTSISLCNLD